MSTTNLRAPDRRRRLQRLSRVVAATLAVTCATVGLATGPAYAAPAAPVTLRAFTGGPSVALLWNQIAAEFGVTRPTIYRHIGNIN